MNILALVNQKGGVGKSTLALNVAAGLAHRGHRTILIDLDPQGTSTAATLGTLDERAGSAELLDQASAVKHPLEEFSYEAPAWGFRIVPSSYPRLRGREASLSSDPQAGQFALLEALGKDESAADVVLLDCPPNYGSLTMPAMTAANGIIAPILPAGESTHGLEMLQKRITVARHVNHDLRLAGVVIIGFQARLAVDQAVYKYISDDAAYGWVQTIRQTSGFRRAFFEQQPLRAVASSDTERAAVDELEKVVDSVMLEVAS